VRRVVLNVVTAVCTVLAFATAALAVAGHWRSDWINYSRVRPVIPNQVWCTEWVWWSVAGDVCLAYNFYCFTNTSTDDVPGGFTWEKHPAWNVGAPRAPLVADSWGGFGYELPSVLKPSNAGAPFPPHARVVASPGHGRFESHTRAGQEDPRHGRADDGLHRPPHPPDADGAVELSDSFYVHAHRAHDALHAMRMLAHYAACGRSAAGRPGEPPKE
jgi:hypothetical protein